MLTFFSQLLLGCNTREKMETLGMQNWKGEVAAVNNVYFVRCIW